MKLKLVSAVVHSVSAFYFCSFFLILYLYILSVCYDMGLLPEIKPMMMMMMN